MPHAAARMATRDRDAAYYQRHRPEQTLLYRIVEAYYPAFTAHLAGQGSELPSCGARRMAESAALLVDEVLPKQPVRQWVLSFPFQLRFLFASQPSIMGQVLGIIYRVIATHLVKKTGHAHKTAKTGAVTLIQRFGSTLNLNIHFHMLFLDGVYVDGPDGAVRFCWVKAPMRADLTQLTHTIAHRVGRYLERQGLLERDIENSYLNSDVVGDEPLDQLAGPFDYLPHRHWTPGRTQGIHPADPASL